MEGNGVTRREFEELKQDLARLDREGSRATGLLARDVVDVSRRVDALGSNITWAARGGLGIVFLVLAGIAIALATGAIGGGG